MQWIAPAEKNADTQTLENRLWAAAGELTPVHLVGDRVRAGEAVIAELTRRDAIPGPEAAPKTP